MTEALIDQVERLLGDFYRLRGFTAKCAENQTSLFGTMVTLESKRFIIVISRDRGDEVIDIGVTGNRRSLRPIGHLKAFLERKQDPYSAFIETQADWLKSQSDALLDEALLESEELEQWAQNAGRRMFGERKDLPRPEYRWPETQPEKKNSSIGKKK